MTPLAAAEYADRWRRLQRGMAEVSLDALLVTSQTNFEYLAGYRTPAWIIRARPQVVVVPATGDPIGVVASTHAVELEGEGILHRLRPYNGFEREATDQLIATVKEEGLASGRIGVESGAEQRLGIPLDEFTRLRDALPGATFRDGGEVLWRARMLKSEGEIARLREAGRIAGEVYEGLLPRIRPGWTERQVYREIVVGTVERGGDAPTYVTMTAGPGGYHRHNAWPRDRAFAPRELFWVDLGATFQGYYSDYTRCAALGEASSGQRDAYRLALEMLDEAVEAVRGGVETRSVLRAAAGAAARSGATLRVASRIGHGLGLDLTEPPSLAEDDTTVLEPGMVLAVEPGVLTEEGWFHLEENVVVREGGRELLSARMPRELPVAGG